MDAYWHLVLDFSLNIPGADCPLEYSCEKSECKSYGYLSNTVVFYLLPKYEES